VVRGSDRSCDGKAPVESPICKKTDAEIAYGDLLRKQGQPSTCTIYLAEYMDQHWQRCKQMHTKKTQDRERLAFKSFSDAISNRRLDCVTAPMIERWLLDRARGVKAQTANRDLAVVKAMFRRAHKYGVIPSNPALAIDPLPVRDRQIRRALTDAEIAALLRDAKEPLRAAIGFVLHTGMRRGELARLTWADLDYHTGFVHIYRAKGRKPALLPFSIAARGFVHELPRTDERVFPRKADWFSHQFARFCKKAKVKGASFHTLRHTFTTRLFQMGVPDSQAKDLLRHADIRTTMVYRHIPAEALRTVMERLQYERGET